MNDLQGKELLKQSKFLLSLHFGMTKTREEPYSLSLICKTNKTFENIISNDAIGNVSLCCQEKLRYASD